MTEASAAPRSEDPHQHTMQRTLLEPLHAPSESLRLAGDSPLTAPAVRRSFLLMAVCFSGNHACVTTVLGLASSELGSTLGGYSSGTLYLCYTLCALLGATAAVQTLGQKGALFYGSVAYCAYVAAFLVAYIGRDSTEIRWTAALGGSVIGGLAAGWLWSAQGAYLTASVSTYVKAQQEEHYKGEYKGASYGSHEAASEAENSSAEARIELYNSERATQAASAMFAGVFSTAYLGIEFCSKILAACLLLLPSGRLITFTTLTAIALLSSCGLKFILDLDSYQLQTPGTGHSYRGTFAALRLLCTDWKMALMYPVQMAFGFSSSFLTFYVSKEIIDEFLGESSVSLLSALVVLVGAVLSMPNSWLAERIGKTPVMMMGLLAFIVVTLCFSIFSAEDLGNWAVMVPLYMLYGYGRCVYEGQNKAVMVEFFENQGAAWGANLIVASGGSSALAFFLFPELDKFAMALICCVTACTALVTFPIAKRLHDTQQRGSRHMSSLLHSPRDVAASTDAQAVRPSV